MQKRIGVTGATGFIGKRLIRRLLKDSFSVTALSRSSQHLSKDVQIIVGDLHDKDSLRKFVNTVDVVVHLAARQVPPDEALFESNVTGTNNLISCLFNSPVKHLVYLSTAAVYGEQEDKVLSERDMCYPSTPYGLTKFLGETVCQYWKTKTNQTLTILRPFNVYGEGSTKGVVYNMIQNIKQNKSITIYGDGKQTRDFLYVEDVVDAIVTALQKEKNGIYNVGSGVNVSLLDLAASLKKLFPGQVEIDFQDSEKGKPKNISYSLEKVKKELGWESQISLEEGLQKVFNG